jgi:nickel-dependent lactate racemase
MKIEMPYGNGCVEIEVPDERVLSVLEPPVKALQPAADVIDAALENPLGSSPLKEIVRKGERTTIVVPDVTRRCDAQTFLPLLLKTLSDSGIDDSDVMILFANGSHGPLTIAQQREVVGAEVYSRVETVDHDYSKTEDLVFLGDTEAGIPVALNKLVVKAERLIVAGGTSHHPFTGYAGGPKLINPGCAGIDTILKSHALGIDRAGRGSDKLCDSAIAGENPIFRDIVDSVKFVRIDFCLHLVVDTQGYVAYACAGSMQHSFATARQLADTAYKVMVPEKTELVIASCGGAPFDDDFVKTFRAIHNASRMLKDDGHLVLIAKCGQGVGHDGFLRFFEPNSPQDLADLLMNEYTPYGNTALGLRELLGRVRITVAGNLHQKDAEEMGLEAHHDLQNAIDRAVSELRQGSKLIFIPSAHFVLPICQEM